MKNILETLFYLGGTILLWGKIGAIVLGFGLIIVGCHKFNKLLKRTRLLRSYANVNYME